MKSICFDFEFNYANNLTYMSFLEHRLPDDFVIFMLFCFVSLIFILYFLLVLSQNESFVIYYAGPKTQDQRSVVNLYTYIYICGRSECVFPFFIQRYVPVVALSLYLCVRKSIKNFSLTTGQQKYFLSKRMSSQFSASMVMKSFALFFRFRCSVFGVCSSERSKCSTKPWAQSAQFNQYWQLTTMVLSDAFIPNDRSNIVLNFEVSAEETNKTLCTKDTQNRTIGLN